MAYVDFIYWREVIVTCAEDPSKNKTFENATVEFRDGGVEVREQGGLGRFYESKSALYARASVLKFTASEVQLNAAWWSHDVNSPISETEYKPISIVAKGPRWRELRIGN